MTARVAKLKQADPVNVTIEWVDPEMAAEWLTHNPVNRKLNAAAIREYGRDMLAGRFHFTGEPIQFDTAGNLQNGQNRLSAIVATGCTVELLIVRGLPPEAQKYMDSGRKRSAADALKIQGVEGDMRNVAAVARGVLLFNNGVRPTKSEVTDYAEQNMAVLLHSALIGKRVQTSPGMRGGVALFAVPHYLLAPIDSQDADFFFETLGSGENLVRGDGINALRELILRGLPGGGRLESRMRTNVALFFKAWNAWRTNSDIKVLRFGRSEEFPTPK